MNLNVNSSSTSPSPSFGNFSPFCQGIPGFELCNLFFHRLINDTQEAQAILLPSCQVKHKGQDGGMGNIGQ